MTDLSLAQEALDYLRSRFNPPHLLYEHSSGVRVIEIFITENGFEVKCLDRRTKETVVTEYEAKA